MSVKIYPESDRPFGPSPLYVLDRVIMNVKRWVPAIAEGHKQIVHALAYVLLPEVFLGPGYVENSSVDTVVDQGKKPICVD